MTLSREMAEEAAETGMLLAAAHADREIGNWSEEALNFFRLYSTIKPDGFLTEDARAWAEKIGLPPPPDGRAWGYIARRASREGFVRSAGYEKARSSNNSPKVLWRAA